MSRWKKLATDIDEAETSVDVVANEVAPQSDKADRKIYTDWAVFDKAGLKIVRLECNENMQLRKYNNGCHTVLVPTPESIKNHLDADHGGSFKVTLADNQGAWKTKDGRSQWMRLGEFGLELQAIMCDVCNEVLRLTPATLKAHMRVHTSKNRRMVSGGEFWITVGYGAPDSADTEDFS